MNLLVEHVPLSGRKMLKLTDQNVTNIVTLCRNCGHIFILQTNHKTFGLVLTLESYRSRLIRIHAGSECKETNLYETTAYSS